VEQQLEQRERRRGKAKRDRAIGEAGAETRTRGFTLLELAIVITIIIILATIGVGRFTRSMEVAHEAALREDLVEMRKAIDNYTLDKKAAPGSLDDLKSAEYLRDIPDDPMTHQKDWITETCDQLMSADQDSTTGICNVHSASEATSLDGTPYSSW
jgi:general secretion pathway protein G